MTEYGDPSIDLVVELAKPSAHDRVLDYACGMGRAAVAVAFSVSEVHAVDEQPEAIDEARRLSSEIHADNIVFKLVDLYALPFPDGHFSLVICRNALHRLPEPVAALCEMARVLSSKGRIVLHEACVDKDSDRAFNELARLREPVHRRYYLRDELDGIVKKAKLQITERREHRVTVDLDYWIEAAAVPAEKAEIIRTRFQDLSVPAQSALDVAFTDRTVAFSYDAQALRLQR
jgi:ubiquinone/menaquinone biosynthesis C-methylase UbiE